ncbi:MAG: alcohol dehydrogenase [Solirubrobacterales bacterium]|jgi:(R,R)-butanediol dehydrogenase/meso-butanediol dehydrogenase/diacetyl reductase|nr:alcohol dehydrogenase [Solirubrobacterales bacterium]
MRAVQVTDEKALAEGEHPDPRPGPGEVEIEVAFCGICGSDLHMLPSPAIPPGTIMGHEFSGRIASVGEGVEDWSPGDRVSVIPGKPCGECPNCLADREHLCGEAVMRGHGLGGRPGAYAERIVVHSDCLFGLPDGVPDEHGALVEPLAVGVHAAELAGLGPEDPAVVLGAGPIGVMCALALRASGVKRVVVVEPGDHRRERIGGLGFTAVALEGVHDAVIAAFDGELPVAVLEGAGHPDALGLALELVAPAGIVVAAGVLEEPVPINQVLLIIKEARIQGAFAYRREDFERSIELLESGRIPAAELITEVAPLARAQEMFDELRRPGTEQLKVLLAP